MPFASSCEDQRRWVGIKHLMEWETVLAVEQKMVAVTDVYEEA